MAKPKPALNSQFRRRNSHAGEAGETPTSPFPDLDAAVSSIARFLPLDSISPMPGQPREDFDEEGLAELAASIERRGVLQPIRVKQLDGENYQLIAGERRWRASRRAGLTTIPAVICAPGDPTEEYADALVENLLRQDLSDIEIARSLQSLMTDWGVEQQEAARRLGFSKSKASKLLAVLRLPREIQANVAAGHLTMDHVEPLLPKGLTDDQRVALAREAIAEGWGSRAFRRKVAEFRDSPEVPPTAKPRARPAGPAADHQAYAEAFGDAFTAATGVDVKVIAARGAGYRIQVPTHDALVEVAQALNLRLTQP